MLDGGRIKESKPASWSIINNDSFYIKIMKFEQGKMTENEINEILLFSADVQRFYCDNVSKSGEYKDKMGKIDYEDDFTILLDDLFHILEENFEFLILY